MYAFTYSSPHAYHHHSFSTRKEPGISAELHAILIDVISAGPGLPVFAIGARGPLEEFQMSAVKQYQEVEENYPEV